MPVKEVRYPDFAGPKALSHKIGITKRVIKIPIVKNKRTRHKSHISRNILYVDLASVFLSSNFWDKVTSGMVKYTGIWIQRKESCQTKEQFRIKECLSLLGNLGVRIKSIFQLCLYFLCFKSIRSQFIKMISPVTQF